MLVHHIHRPEAIPTSSIHHLTDREWEILALLAEGLSNAEIGQRLNISHYTVRSHVYRIFSKLHLRSRTQAALIFLKMAAANP